MKRKLTQRQCNGYLLRLYYKQLHFCIKLYADLMWRGVLPAKQIPDELKDNYEQRQKERLEKIG